jgi:hypothetical protein
MRTWDACVGLIHEHGGGMLAHLDVCPKREKVVQRSRRTKTIAVGSLMEMRVSTF